jgi:MYXO-CTERM domain-containing protein
MSKAPSLILALSLVGASTGVARAQLGPGWVQYAPPSVLHLEVHDVIQVYPPDSTNLTNEGAHYTNMNGIETFEMLNTTSNRVERRMENNYTAGRWQFEGEVRVSPPTDNESIMQVWGGTQSGATTQMIRAYAEGNGTIKKVGGSVVMATNVYGRWVRINVIHDVAANQVRSYAEGKLMATGPGDAPGPWYHKYGDYGTVTTGTAKVEWRNVRHFKDGNFPAGNSTPPPIADAGSAGGSGGDAVDAGSAGSGGAGGSDTGGSGGSTGGSGGSTGGAGGSTGGASGSDTGGSGGSAGAAGTSGGQSGSGGAGGSTGGTGAGGAGGMGGTSGTGGTSGGDTGGAGGDDGTGGSTTTGPKRATGSGGCSFAAGNGAGGVLALVALAVGLIVIRRRRR